MLPAPPDYFRVSAFQASARDAGRGAKWIGNTRPAASDGVTCASSSRTTGILRGVDGVFDPTGELNQMKDRQAGTLVSVPPFSFKHLELVAIAPGWSDVRCKIESKGIPSNPAR